MTSAPSPPAPPPAPPSAPSTSRRDWLTSSALWLGRNWMTVTNAIVLSLCCLLILGVLHPELLVTNTTTAGGDTGAHVWWPAFLRDYLLPEGKVAGWSQDFYNGFPAGQFYFPIPALMVVVLDVVLPYNIAFKLVTAVGAVALPLAAFVFGRGLRLRFPAPLFMGLATLAFLLFKGDPRSGAPYSSAAFNQRIMGGTLASTLAGEFSFTIALCFALCFLGVFALTLRGGRRPIWAVLLLAATVLSHVIVGIFVGIAAVVVVAFRLLLDPDRRDDLRAGRIEGLVAGGSLVLALFVGVATVSVWWTLPSVLVAVAAGVWFARGDRNRVLLVAAGVGGVAALLTAFWSIPLVARFPYTSNMAYEKLVTNFELGNPANGLNLYLFPNYGARGIFPWVFLLGVLALAVAFVDWRPGVLIIATITVLMGVLFVQWPELHAWNLRFLPFWYLGWIFLAAIGLAELVCVPGTIAESLQRREEARKLASGTDAPADAPADASADSPAPAASDGAAVGSDAPIRRDRSRTRALAASLTAMLTVVGVVGGLVWARSEPSVGFLDYWAEYNYTGYEWVSSTKAAGSGARPKSGPCTNPPKRSEKYAKSGKAYPEYAEIMQTMSELPPGRALWEPSASLDKYGTSLALMLLPYCTEHRIASSEGLYFEAAGTTAYHFVTVSQLAQEPSNPMRFPRVPSPYGRITEDFDLGVRHLQMLGIRYYMAQSQEAKQRADVHPSLRRVATVPDRDQTPPSGWNIYEVQDSPLVEGLQYLPLVVRDKDASGWQQSGSPWLTDWFNDPSAIDRVLAADGPKSWVRANAADAKGIAVGEQLPPVEVSNVRTTQESIRFTVSQPGVPVLVKTSYYPNWEVSGASGVYRASPNFMVVVPTSNDVTLRFTRASVDWWGMFLTLIGLFALVPMALWKPRSAYPEDAIDIDADLKVGGDGPGSPETLEPTEPTPLNAHEPES